MSKKKYKIISIDKFIKDEDIGNNISNNNIDYHYQHTINIYNFFTLLILKKIKKFNIMCIPQFRNYYAKYADRATTILDLYNNDTYFPKDMIKEIQKCIKKKNTRFIYFSFQIKNSKNWFTHMNIIIIDLKKKTLERFEPYGAVDWYDQAKVDKFFKKFVLKFLKLKSFKYLNPLFLSKKVGIQSKVDLHGGMCVTLSSMYLHMRIINANVSQKTIVNHFLKMSKKKLKSTILKYSKYIEKTLKSNSKFINKSNYNLFNKIKDINI